MKQFLLALILGLALAWSLAQPPTLHTTSTSAPVEKQAKYWKDTSEPVAWQWLR